MEEGIDNPYYVNLEEATVVAENNDTGSGDDSNSNSRKNPNKGKKSKRVEKVRGESGEVIFYVINFKEGGFMVVSADSRREPILAFAEDGEFKLDEEFYPGGLVEWIETTGENIEYIRKKKLRQRKWVKDLWKEYSNDFYNLNTSTKSASNARVDPDDGIGGSSCSDLYITVGPLLTTNWSQTGIFNDAVPDEGCFMDPNALAGCVAIAMGQVMNHHQFPTSYNWASMTNAQTATLIRDIGDAVDMNYGCDVSGANTEDEFASSLKGDFGYSSASHRSFDRNLVKNDLKYNRPVVLSACENIKNNYILFKTYKDCHAWVCDGYRSSTIYSEDCQMAWGYLYLHMNWGWGVNRGNGWYSNNSWTSVNGNYKYRQNMVYNIKR
ncbi:MAG: C10 family peptidase [Reichenbachiella sp.]